MNLSRKVGDIIEFDGMRGVVAEIMETYRKNVLVVALIGEYRTHRASGAKSIGLFEYPDGTLKFMNVNEWI